MWGLAAAVRAARWSLLLKPCAQAKKPAEGKAATPAGLGGLGGVRAGVSAGGRDRRAGPSPGRQLFKMLKTELVDDAKEVARSAPYQAPGAGLAAPTVASPS